MNWLEKDESNLTLATPTSEHGNEFKLQELQQRLSDGLAKREFQNTTELIEEMQEAEKRIKKCEKHGRTEEARKEIKYLHELKKLQQLHEEICSLGLFTFVSTTDDQLKLRELEQKFSSGLSKKNIRDATELLEEIQEAETQIKRYEKQGRTEEAEDEKEFLRVLKELQQLNEEICSLKPVPCISERDDRFKLRELELKFSSGLSKRRIKDATELQEDIQEAEKRIKKCQTRGRTEESQKEMEFLRELQKLRKLWEEICSITSTTPCHNIAQLLTNPMQTKLLLNTEVIVFNQKDKIRLYLNDLHEDLATMPSCAEKSIMGLLIHFQGKLLGDCLSLRKGDPMIPTLQQLQDHLRRQDLLSAENQESFHDLDEAICSKDHLSAVQVLEELRKRIRPLNTQEIQRLITKAQKAAASICEKEIVLLVGETGSGKSTTIQFLAGSIMKETRVEIDSGKFLEHITAVEPVENDDLRHVTSSPLNKSETRYIAPVKIYLTHLYGAQRKGIITLCDAPGFGDTAGPEVDIANSIGVIEALKGTKNVKLLALSSYKSLGDRGEGIQRLARILSRMVKRIEKKLNCIFYAFTKYPETVDINAVLTNIKTSTLGADCTLRSDSTFVTVLSDMIEKTEKGAYKINPINDDPKEIIQKLIGMDGIDNPEEAFQFSMSEKTRESIANHIQKDKSGIECAMKQKDIDLVLYYFIDLKILHNLIKENIVEDAYKESIRSVSENISRYCTEVKKTFNRALASQDGLEEKDILDYKVSVVYLEQAQRLQEHLGSDLLSPETLIQNIKIQLQERKSALKEVALHKPSVGIYLDNLRMLKISFEELQMVYNSDCVEFEKRFEDLVQFARKLIPTNQFGQLAEVILNISQCSHVLKTHSHEQIDDKYREIIQLLKQHLTNVSEKADPLLNKNRLDASDVKILRDYMETLRSAKESPPLQDRMFTYFQMLKNKDDVSQQQDASEVSEENRMYLNGVYNEFMLKISRYFEKINLKINELLGKGGDNALEDIEELVKDMDTIRTIPELEFRLAGTYHRTVSDIREYMQQMEKDAEKLLETISHESQSNNYGEIARSLLRLKNAQWINHVTPGAHDTLMRRVKDRLVQYAHQLRGQLKKLDFSLKYSDNVCRAQEIVENMESISSLGCNVPELEKFRKDISERFLQTIDSCFNRIQRLFSVENQDLYQMRQKLKELEEIKGKYESLSTTSSSDSSQAIDVLQENQFDNPESLDEVIREKKRNIAECEKVKPKYDFRDGLDASTVNNALLYVNECEKVSYDNIRKKTADISESLLKYISEYSNFVNDEIRRTFNLVANRTNDTDLFQCAHSLSIRIQELSSLSEYKCIFECIDGAKKVKNWQREFLDYHRTLSVKAEEFKTSGKSKDLESYLLIAQSLSCLDSFCGDVLQNNGFGVLYKQYQAELYKNYQEAYKTVLDCVSKGDYEKANLELEISEIHIQPLNARALADIKHALKSSLDSLAGATRSIVNRLDGKFERTEENESQIRDINENMKRIQITFNKSHLNKLLDIDVQNYLKNFEKDINKKLSEFISNKLHFVTAFMNSDHFSEAEQVMRNISRAHRELGDHCISESVTKQATEVKERLENIADEISRRDHFVDIKTYPRHPPKVFLANLEKAAEHYGPKYTEAHFFVSKTIETKFCTAINDVRSPPWSDRSAKLNALLSALNYLPQEMQDLFKSQIDEQRKLVDDDEIAHRRELDEIVKNSEGDDDMIKKLGELALRYGTAGMNELLRTVCEQILAKLSTYRANVESSLDKQDMQSALDMMKRIFKYKESVGTYVPEIEGLYKAIRDLIIKGILNCSEILTSIFSIEHTQTVEIQFNNIVIYIGFFNTSDDLGQEFLSQNVLETVSEGFQKISEYMSENSKRFRVVLTEISVVELYRVIMISKQWDGLLQKIKQCRLKHDLIQTLSKDIESIIPYADMICELEIAINQLGTQLNVELINDDTNIFEKKREEFFRNLMKAFSTLKALSSKFKSVVQPTLDVEKIEDELKKRVESIGTKLINHASKTELSSQESDSFRTYYNHLSSFDRHVRLPGVDVRHFLELAGEKIFERVTVLRKEIGTVDSSASEVADTLIKLKFLAENLSMFETKINAELDEALKSYKEKQGSVGIMQLTMALEKTETGTRLISEHSCLSGEDWRKRREKMQNQDNLTYVLNGLSGDDIDTNVLTSRYLAFRRIYENLLSTILSSSYQKIEREANLDVLISKTKLLVETVTQRNRSITWNDSFINKIPDLLAHIFAVWTLKNTEHYNTMRGIESAQAYLLMPHAAQVIAIFRLLGIGYNSRREIKGYNISLTGKISDDLVSNLVEIGTGEGKSVVLAVTACVFALIGLDVNCSCYSEVLSLRDRNDFASVFRALGIEERIEYGTFNKLCEQVLNEQCNVRENVRDMIVNNKSNITAAITKSCIRLKVLLIDEVDVFLSDQFYGGTYTPSVFLRDPAIKALLDALWQDRKIRNLNTVKTMPAYKNCLSKFNNWTFLLDEATKDMLTALQSFQFSTYMVQNDKIVYIEGQSVVANVVRGYDTIWAYYYESEIGNISQRSLEDNVGIIINCGTFSYAEMPHDFAYIAGVTGTLKTLAKPEKNILRSVYSIQKMTYMPSVFGSGNRTFNSNTDVRVVKESEYFMEIRGEVGAVCNANRAILVFFESEEKLMAFYNSSELSSIQKDVQIIIETISIEERELYRKRASIVGKITLLTRTFGRGTDFICRNQQLLANGGIHVLQTFFSDELSEEYQIMGRGARQGDRGSYRMILLDKDLERFLGSTWKEQLPRIAGTTLYEALNKARDVQYESKCSGKELGIEQCKRGHKASKDFMAALIAGKIEAVKGFLTEQNRGANLIASSSRTILLMDATGSMSSLLSAAKETVCTMFERASFVLEEKGLSNKQFQMQFAVYRDYDCKEDGVLQSSSWETKPTNLRSFMTTITAVGGGDYEEAIEVGLCHAVQQSEQLDGICQVILVGDAPAKTKEAIERDRQAHGGKFYWDKTKFKQATHFAFELEKLKDKNIPVHAFYLADGARTNFQQIADATRGRCEHLDILSPQGAELLTNFVTEEVLRKTAGALGDSAVELYRQKYTKRTFTS